LGTAKCGVYSKPFTISVFKGVKDTIAATSCDNYTWHGTNYNTNGYYSFDTVTTSSPHCDSLTTLHLTLKHSTTSTIDTTVCLTYTWPLSGQTYTANGNYSYDIIGANSVGCDSTVTLTLTVESPLSVAPISSSSSDTIVSGETITLTDSSTNGVWESESPSVAAVTGVGNSAAVKGGSQGIDTVWYIISNVCKADTASFPIVVNTSDVFIPNLFSPNGNGHNDVFYLRGSSSLYKDVELWIFNAWGNLVFDRKGAIDDPTSGWDGSYNGQKQPTGVYVYVAKLNGINGATVTKKGSITLIR
jgi:gliding motility-associated-like protein